MKGTLIMIGVSVAGSIGWWMGSPLGIWGSFIISTVLSGFGFWGSRRIVQELLP